jgi:MFS family permease
MQSVGQGWLALELSNSAFIVGIVSAAGSLPILALSLYAGVIADRYSKLKLVRVAQTLLALEAVVLWWFTWSGHITVPWLITLAAINGVISAFEIPARQSLIVELVGKDDLVDAIALNSGGFNLARIIGPSVAALVIATAGLSWCFGLNALSYLTVLASLFMVRLPPWMREIPVTSPLEGILEGLRYVRYTPHAWALIKIIAVYSVFGLPYLSMMPVFARDVLQTGASGYGFLLTSVGIGAFLGALGLAAFGASARRGKLFATTAYVFALSLVAFSLVRHPAAAAAVLLVSGCTMLLNGSLANGMLQAVVPDALRGRVMAAYVFVYVGFAPIGSFLLGTAAQTFGVTWAIAGGGVVMLLYTLWELSRSRGLITGPQAGTSR